MSRPIVYLSGVIILVVVLSLPPPTHSADECITVTAPAPNTVVISKTPEIKVAFRCAIKADSLVVILDAVDVTQLLDKTEKGFTYRPETMVTIGNHILKISYLAPDGTQKQQDLTFISRHSQAMGEAYSKNNATLIYAGAVVQTSSATQAAAPFDTNTLGTQPAVAPSTTAAIPRSKLEANLTSENKLREDNRGVTLTATVRYLDQDIPVADPLRKGFTVPNWLLTGNYEKDKLKAKFNAGDVIINETPFTVSNLSRKGTILSGEWGPVFLNAFSGRMEQSFGVDGGIGIGNSDRDHILGASGGIKLFNNQMEARVIYVSGTDPSTLVVPAVIPAIPPIIQPNTFGSVVTPGQKSGNAASFLLKTDFFTGKLRTEIEATTANFDPDITDEFGKRNAVAYRAKAGGAINWYTYEIGYEYVGKYFGVVGNLAQPKDRQGFNVMNGINLSDQNLSVIASRYVDNVEDDPLFARNVATTGTITYQFRKIPHVPLGFTYTKSMQESKNVPDLQTPVDLHTDIYSAQIGFTAANLNVNFSPSYSLIDDRTPANADITSITYVLTAGYTHPLFSFTPAFSWNRSRNLQTDVSTDIYTGNVDLRTKFLNSRASFDIGGTYALSKANDGSAHNETWNGRAGLSYNIGSYWKKIPIKPVASIRCNYLKISDKVNPAADKDEISVLVVLETAASIFF